MKPSHIFWGLLFVALGLLVLINNFTSILMDWSTIWKLWPLTIVLGTGLVPFALDGACYYTAFLAAWGLLWLRREAIGVGLCALAALQWALARGSRSGRVAWQFARDYAGRVGMKKPR